MFAVMGFTVILTRRCGLSFNTLTGHLNFYGNLLFEGLCDTVKKVTVINRLPMLLNLQMKQ